MENQNEKNIISWKIPEYAEYEKSKNWYLLAIIIGSALLIYSLFTANFLFAVIIVVAAAIMIMRRKEEMVFLDVVIDDDGVQVGKKHYDYDDFKNFSIVYKPKEETKNLYFEFKGVIKPRLSIPLENENPLPIRKNLLKYLEEDLERTDMPLSEQLAKIFKL